MATESYERLDQRGLPRPVILPSYSTFDWRSSPHIPPTSRSFPGRTRSKSRISIESMDESESSLIMISSRPPSVRSRMVDPVVLSSEPDTFCVLPSRMRALCLILTLLLVASLFAAIANSLQTAHAGSASFCKPQHVDFNVKSLCQKETMFVYYKCCTVGDDVQCCPRFKYLLMIALGCVTLSCAISLGFAIAKYIFRC